MTTTAEPPPTTAAQRVQLRVRTLRRDRWWLQPLVYAIGLAAFVIYSLYAVFIDFFTGVDYYTGAQGSDYLSPFYSPCISSNCPGGAQMFHATFPVPTELSPGLIVLIFPLLFRTTCYYYRKAYYRSFWLSPPACAVAEPHQRYTGERRFPLILQNTHRIWWYFAVLFAAILTYDAVVAFHFPASASRASGLGFGVGTAVLIINAVLIWGYTLGCHSCRHIVGGRLTHFSRHPLRYRFWTFVSRLNTQHMQWAWTSLIWIALTDVYIRLVATGLITDPHWIS